MFNLKFLTNLIADTSKYNLIFSKFKSFIVEEYAHSKNNYERLSCVMNNRFKSYNQISHRLSLFGSEDEDCKECIKTKNEKITELIKLQNTVKNILENKNIYNIFNDNSKIKKSEIKYILLSKELFHQKTKTKQRELETKIANIQNPSNHQKDVKSINNHIPGTVFQHQKTVPPPIPPKSYKTNSKIVY